MKYTKRILMIWQVLICLTFTANFLTVSAQPTQTGKLTEAQKLFDEASQLYDQLTAESLQTALPKFVQAATLFEQAKDAKKQATSITMAGRICESLGKREDALNYYKNSLQISELIKDYELMAYIYNNIGNVLLNLNKNDESLKNYQLAIDAADKNTDVKKGNINKSLTYYNLARLYEVTGNTQKAGDALKNSIDLGDLTQNADIIAISLTTFARIQSSLGDSKTALEVNERALGIAKQLKDKDLEATVLNNIGQIYYDTGDLKKALEYYDSAEKTLQNVFDKNLEATILNNISMAQTAAGDRQKAIEFLNKSLVIARAISNTKLEADILNNFGLNYYALNDRKKALEYYNSALKIAQETGSKRQESATLLNLGELYSANLDYENALKYFSQALKITEESFDVQLSCTIINNIGLLFLRAKDANHALLFFNRALPPAHERGFRSIEATLLANIASAYSLLGDKVKTADYYNQSIVISQSIGDKTQVAGILGNIMLLWNDLGNRQMAIFFGKQSINIYQQLRGNISNLDKNLQKTYLDSIEDVYRQTAEILIAQGRIAEAEQVLGMLKQDEYLDYLRRDDSVANDLKGKISLTPEEQDAFKRYAESADKITALGKEYGDLQTESKSFEVGKFPKQAQLDALEKQLADANKVFNAFLDDLKVKFGQEDKRVASVESDTQALLKEINQPHTVIITTIAGEDKLNLIVTTADVQRAHKVEIKVADLNKLVLDFREAVKNPNIDPRPLGKQLFDILFPAALQKDLENIKADTIVWSLDGTLRYVPIAALWDGKQYLAEKYNNSVINLASRDKLNAPTSDRTKWQALGVGVSKEANLKNADGSTQNFNALTAVPEELCSIITDSATAEKCRKNGVIAGKTLLDDEFTMVVFKANLGRFPIVHIASHFSLNAGNETDSYLLLGGTNNDERKLSIAALREQFKTKFVGVELLTLSACNTAMTAGKNSNGLEVEGFGAFAQKQGAKSVLATLWSVADSSTRDLMTEFYKQLETNPNIGKTEALRNAQIKLLNGNYKSDEAAKKRGAELVGTTTNTQPPFKKDANAPYSHPYYWSPFVLIGNWK